MASGYVRSNHGSTRNFGNCERFEQGRLLMGSLFVFLLYKFKMEEMIRALSL